jgi:hypothetical protein
MKELEAQLKVIGAEEFVQRLVGNNVGPTSNHIRDALRIYTEFTLTMAKHVEAKQ